MDKDHVLHSVPTATEEPSGVELNATEVEINYPSTSSVNGLKSTPEKQ